MRCRSGHCISSGPVLLLLCICAAGFGQDAPRIDKVDPPNWFAAMTGQAARPMLLVHGEGLKDASFNMEKNGSADGVQITRTMSSPNGHWAMVWLDTHAASAGILHMEARSPGGVSRFEYRLERRRAVGDGAGGFGPGDVMYLIMPDRYADGDTGNNRPAESPGSYDRTNPRSYHGGDLRGVTEHLDYLQGLGVTAVWLTPMLKNSPTSRDYHGYGATDMYAVDPHLGTLAEYRALGAELHRRGMKLIFDDVPNHVGPGHVWVSDSPLPDWFHGTAAKHLESSATFDPITDPHAPARDSYAALDGWFVNVLADMNQDEPVVAQYETQNMIWWIEEAGIDGLRIDTFPYVQRTFWQNYLSELQGLYPTLRTVGEVSGDDATINAFFAGGRKLLGVDTHLDTPFDYPMYFSLRAALLGRKPMSSLETTLRQDWLYPHAETLVTFIGNHDQPRFMSEPHATPELLQLGFGLLMTMRGTPQLYAGDEIGMTGGEDPDNRRDFPGGFAGDPENAFMLEGRTVAQNKMHDWVAALGKLRLRTLAMREGLQQTVFADETGFGFVRMTGTTACGGSAAGSVLVMLNRSAEARVIRVPVEGTALAGCTQAKALLGSGTAAFAGQAGEIRITGLGFTVFEVR